MTGSLHVRNNKYYVVLSFLNEKGVWKQKWISTKLDVKGNKLKAKEFLSNVLNEYERKNLEHDGLSVSDYFTQWIDRQKNKISPSTYRSYRGYMLNHIIPYFSEKCIKMNDLKAYHLEDYYDAKSADDHRLSAQTIKHHHRIISKALNDAVKREIISMNPAVNAAPPKVEKFVGTFLNPEQLQELLRLVKGTLLELPITFLVIYGLRRSELLGLCWQSIDFGNEQFTISRVLIQHPGGDYLKPFTKNDSSYRTLPMTPTIKRLLLQKRETQERYRKLCGKEYTDSDFVFTWDDGRPITPNYLTVSFRKMIVNSSLPTIRLHDLRHSAASNLLAMNYSVVEVQHWLGHSQPSTTLNFYSHVDSQSKKSISNRLETTYTLF